MPAFTLTPTDNGSGWTYVGPHWRADTTLTHLYSNVSNLPAEAVSISDPVIQYIQFQDAFSAQNITAYHKYNGASCGGHSLNTAQGAYAWFSDSKNGLTWQASTPAP